VWREDRASGLRVGIRPRGVRVCCAERLVRPGDVRLVGRRCSASARAYDAQEGGRERLRRGELLDEEGAMSIPRGIGIGLRSPLAQDILERPPPELAWLEICPENYMRRGGRFPTTLAQCAERWPIVTHGLAMSLGGVDPLDREYLAALARFARDLDTPWHSDHLSFGIIGGVALHDLLPVPFTRPAAEHVAARIRQAQDVLDRPLAIENITYYARPPGDEMDEGDFVAEVLRAAGCSLLLDVNNIYVNGRNHGFDPRAALAKMPLDRVVQIHVAGHDDSGFCAHPLRGPSDDPLVIDTHAEPIVQDVYDLLGWTLERTGPAPILLERDDRFPPWEDLCDEIRTLHRIAESAARRRSSMRADPHALACATSP
jgi:uncharacterized protein (UPF0276 family)